MKKVININFNVVKFFQLMVFAVVLSAFSSNVSAETVNINTADAQTLQLIPGIGPDRSSRIIKLRKQNQGFVNYDELLAVKGIGTKTLVRIKKYASLNSGISTLPAQLKKIKRKKSAKAKTTKLKKVVS